MNKIIEFVKRNLTISNLTSIIITIALINQWYKALLLILILYFVYFSIDLFRNFPKYEAMYQSIRSYAESIVLKNSEKEDETEK